MAALLDLIGALVIRGGIIMILLQLTLSMQDVLYERTEKAAMDRSMYEASLILGYDVRLMGYHVASDPVVALDTNRITFYADLRNAGTADKIAYYVSEMTGTPDTLHIKKYYLNRSLNDGNALPLLRYVTRFRIDCYDSLGALTTNMANIRSVFLRLSTQSNNFFNGRYPSSAWQSQIFPQNM